MAAVGAVHVDVVPSTREFVKDMAKDLLAGADKQGKDLGEKIGKEASKSLAKEMSDGLDETLGEDAGKKAGGSFAKGLKAEIAKALESLPDIELDADTKGVEKKIGKVREQLEKLQSKDIGVDITGAKALEKVAAIRDRLDSLRDRKLTVDLDFDVDQAVKDLGALQRKIADEAGGSFDKSLREGLQHAIDQLPTVEIDANTDPAKARLAALKAELQAFSDADSIDINIDAEAALADVERIAAELQALVDDESLDLKVRIDAKAALGSLTAIQEASRNLKDEVADVDREFGSFARTIETAVGGALRNLPELQITGGDAARQEILSIRDAITKLGEETKLDVDLVDAPRAIASLEAIRDRLKVIAKDDSIDLRLRLDAADTLKSLDVIDGMFKKLDDTVGKTEVSIGNFAATARKQLENALSHLPDLQINTGPAAAEIARIKEQINLLTDDVQLGLSAEDALVQVGLLRAALAALVNDENVELKVRMDAAQAIANLDAIEDHAKGMQDRFKLISGQVDDTSRNIGAFAANAQKTLEQAFNRIPSFKIDNSPARTSLAEIRDEIGAFKDLEIGVDINSKDALAGIEVLLTRLRAIEAMDVSLDIKSNARGVIADLEAIKKNAGIVADDAAKQIDRALGHFGEKIKTELGNAIASLPVIDVKANTNPALDAITDLRRRAEAIQARFTVDGDTVKARAEIDALLARARELSFKSYSISVKADVAQAVAGLEAARAATLGISEASNLASGGMSRFRLILGLIVALLPLISGALLGISALIAALGIPIAAIAAGMDGIKRAVAALSDEMFTLKSAVAGAFESGLAPAIANIAKIFPTLTQGLVGTALALSDVATRVSRVVSSASGLSVLQSAFTGVNTIIRDMGPALATFTSNFLRLISIGTAGMTGFGVQLQGVATAFSAMIDRISASGTAQAAIQALFAILNSLIGLIGPITELGAVLLAAIGPGLAAALSGVGAVISGVAVSLDYLGSTFGAFGQAAETVLATFLAVRLALLAFGVSASANAALVRGLGIAMTALGVAGLNVQAAFSVGTLNGIAAGFRAIMVAAKGALLAFITNPVALIITGIVVALTALTSANASAAAAEQEHQAAVDNLSNALKQSGGAIDANIVKLTEKRLAELGAGDSMDRLKLSSMAVAQAVASGGPAYDQLIAKLDQTAAASKTYINQGGMTVRASSGMATASAQLSEKLKAARQEFIDSANDQAVYADALRNTGFSLVSGVGYAQQLQEALGTLGDKTADTSAKVKALDDALRALSGGQLTLEEATKKINDALRGLGDEFKKAGDAARQAKVGLLEADGSIRTTTEAGSKLFDSVMNVREGMLAQATSAFDAAGGLNNVGAASAAAESKVLGAREAFIKAAGAAGIGATEAGKLADRYGLIPKVVSTLLRAENLPVVQADIQALKAQLESVPKDTPIHVQVISNEAKQLLKDIGVQVVELPDGSIDVIANDETKAKVAGIIAAINANKGNLPVGTDGKPLLDQVPGLRDQISSGPAGNIPVGAKDKSIGTDIVPMLEQIGGKKADVHVGAQDETIVTVGGIVATINSKTGTMSILAKDPEARAQLDSFIAAVNGAHGVSGIGATDALGREVLGGFLLKVDKSTGTVTANLNDTLARQALDELTRQREVTLIVNEIHRIQQENLPAPLRIRGAGGYATAGGVDLMANGGMRQASRMSAASARIVPPNTWRVIGDRQRGDEAFIPVNKSARSQSILGLTAQQMGFNILPMAGGGFLGGLTKKKPASGAAASGAGGGDLSVPEGDAEGASGAASATTELGTAMEQATSFADKLRPALAAITTAQQDMISSGVTPLASAMTGVLAPALAAYQAQVGTAAPAANATLQASQALTQASTTATAANAVVNGAAITAATTGMAVGVQTQHAGVQASQGLTQASTTATAVNAATNNAGMVNTTAGMSVGVQAQHAGVRAGQAVTQGSTTATAANMSANNANMQATTATMSTVNQGHLTALRGAQGVTSSATAAFADAWRAQLARTQPDSGNPIRWVINYPLKSLVDAWNNLDGQFALGKHVNPAGANFATGGIMPGYTPGRDVMTANVSGGEAIMRPEWTREMGPGYINAANRAARRGGRAGVQDFLANGGSYAEGGIVPSGGGNPMVDDAFKKAFQEISDVMKNFGASPQVSRDQGVAKFAGDKVKAEAEKKIAEMFAALGGVPVPPGPILEILRATAAQFGWAGEPNWGALLQLVGHESGFRNTAQNPTSTAYGLFQFLDSTWASTGIAKTSDPSLQALAGMRYIRQRYGSPASAWNFWQAHHSYDKGGVASGRGMMFKDVINPERVLSSRQTIAFEKLVAGLTAGRPQAQLDQVSVSAAEALSLAESMRDIKTKDTGSFAAQGGAGAAGTVLGAGSGRDAKNVEARLDAMIGLLQATSDRPQTINVEDRSGNPVETARATQLALRLSRR